MTTLEQSASLAGARQALAAGVAAKTGGVWLTYQWSTRDGLHRSIGQRVIDGDLEATHRTLHDLVDVSDIPSDGEWSCTNGPR